MSTEERIVTLSNEQTQELIDKLRVALDSAKQRGLNLVAVGRTGVGKSSTINALMGSELAPVGRFEPTTTSVEKYKTVLNGIPCTLADTPGLCEQEFTPAENSDYLRKLMESVKTVDCLLFVTQLNFNRVDNCEKSVVRDLSTILQAKIWSSAIIVFTHANTIKADSYNETFTVRTRLIREEIAKYAPGVADSVPAIAIDTTSTTAPDGATWLPELYMAVIRRLPPDGVMPYIIATKPDLSTMSPKDIQDITSRLPRDEGSGFGDTLAFLYTTVGPGFFIGSVIGGPVGGAIGAVLGPAALIVVGLAEKIKNNK